MATLEKEVKERVKKDTAKEQAESEQPIINPGGFGTLLLTQGGIGSVPAPAPPMYTNGVSNRDTFLENIGIPTADLTFAFCLLPCSLVSRA